MSDEREDFEPGAEQPLDLSAFEAAAPPPGFADRVVAKVRAEQRPAPKRTRWVAAGAGIAAAAAALVLLRARGAPSIGETVAEERTDVAIGTRAKAVLEPGAKVQWHGDDVVQSRGDVFYRVEPGATFRVHTPAGEVDVRGTCFAVKVRGEEMQKRDVKAGAIGAAISTLAFVAVYEGKVGVSYANDSLVLSAGESAKLGGGKVERSGTPAEGERAFASAAEQSADDVPLAKANENLAAQVSEYKKRLELVATKKSELEAELAKAEAKLAGAQDGAVPRTRSEYDLDQSDWAELAKQGQVKFRVPCLMKGGWTPNASQLDKLGLAPGDAQTMKEAYERSYQRVWKEIRPMCQTALGSSADAVDKIGPQSCMHLVYDIASTTDPEAAAEAHTAAAEIRAGLRPMPGPNERVHPVTKMFLVLTGELPQFEADLAKSLGPEEAHRIAFSDTICRSDDRWGGGKKREPEKRP